MPATKCFNLSRVCCVAPYYQPLSQNTPRVSTSRSQVYSLQQLFSTRNKNVFRDELQKGVIIGATSYSNLLLLLPHLLFCLCFLRFYFIFAYHFKFCLRLKYEENGGNVHKIPGEFATLVWLALPFAGVTTLDAWE